MNYPSRIIAIDLETTGLIAQYDYIVQIGAVAMVDGEVVGVPFSTRMKPDEDKLKITLGAMGAQCGDLKTPEGQKRAAEWLSTLLDAPKGLEVAQEFKEWCVTHDALKSPTVAHNAFFDAAFMREKLFCFTSVFKTPPLSPMWIDTLTMAKHAWPTGKKYGLNECLFAAELPSRPDHHDALQDAVLCGRLYHHLAQMLTTEVERVA